MKHKIFKTLPSTLGGYPVTHIGEFAFNRCSSLGLFAERRKEKGLLQI